MSEYTPDPHLTLQHQIQLEHLHREIEILRDNHIEHLREDVESVKKEISTVKTEFDKRFDRLDDRLWMLVGLTATTLITIVLAAVFNAG